MWAAAAFAAAPDQHRWETYTNARFHYSLCYPADLLAPQGEAENGDGQAFRTRDGAIEAMAYGAYRLADGVKDEYRKRLRFAEEDGRVVTYKALKRWGLVLSGTVGDKVFYERTALAGDAFETFRITYPIARKAEWGALTARMAACPSAGGVGD